MSHDHDDSFHRDDDDNDDDNDDDADDADDDDDDDDDDEDGHDDAFVTYFIPLWWNHKFQNLSRCATHNTPTSDAELFSNFRLVSSVYRTWEW